MTFVWQYFPEGGSRLLLLLALADFADDNGERIFPSVATLAAKVRLSERAVQYLLRKLEQLRWLEVVVEGGGRRRTRLYRIPVERLKRLHRLFEEGRSPESGKVKSSAKKDAKATAPDTSESSLTKGKGAKVTAPIDVDKGHEESQKRDVTHHLDKLKAALTNKPNNGGS